ncbi:MAG: N-acetylglucosamine-6-phosphate deacetylase [Chloroflexota bacterium]
MSATAVRSLWGRVLTDGQEIGPVRVELARDRIGSVRSAKNPEAGDLVIERGWIAPGFIDLQVNGAGGVDLTATDDLDRVAGVLAARGITAFCPTVVSSPRSLVVERIAAYRARSRRGGAASLGAHIEGPFLNAAHRGVHEPSALRDATGEEIDAWLEAGPPRIVTLAPERSGSTAAIAQLRAAGVVVSLGHSDADAETTDAALDLGAQMATHLFNAMPPLHHRAPGLVGALLASRARLGVIADGVHLDRLIVDLVIRRAGAARVVLVSDCLAAAASPPGPSRLGDQAVMSDGRMVRRADGTLAGSARLLDECVGQVRSWMPDVEPAQVVQMVTDTPARLVGATDRGRVAPGCVADLVVLDDALRVQQVVLRGELL